jgi:hypothetical protein
MLGTRRSLLPTSVWSRLRYDAGLKEYFMDRSVRVFALSVVLSFNLCASASDASVGFGILQPDSDVMGTGRSINALDLAAPYPITAAPANSLSSVAGSASPQLLGLHSGRDYAEPASFDTDAHRMLASLGSGGIFATCEDEGGFLLSNSDFWDSPLSLRSTALDAMLGEQDSAKEDSDADGNALTLNLVPQIPEPSQWSMMAVTLLGVARLMVRQRCRAKHTR